MVTVLFAVLIPPPQLNVEPVALDDAVSTSLTFEQVSGVGVAMLATGAVMFCVTVTDAVLLHPLDGSVTETV